MLTELILNTLVATDTPIKKSDGGLHIHVVPLGRKHWRLAYRFDGKQKTIDGGEYPAVSLHRARVWREEMKELIAKGVDPIEQKKEDSFQAKAETVTFEMLAREWMAARRPSWTPRYARLIEGRLKADILPILGGKPVRSILPRTILEALRVIEARGSFEMAHRVNNHCSEMFRFGIPDGRCDSDPCDLTAAMIKPPPVQHRAKVEIKDLPEFFARLKADERSQISHLSACSPVTRDLPTRPFSPLAPVRSSSGHQQLYQRLGVSFQPRSSMGARSLRPGLNRFAAVPLKILSMRRHVISSM